MKRTILNTVISAAAALGLGSCINSVGNSKPVITVSIEPQRWLLERIVGDKMEVRTLLSTGGNPESYEPAFSHMATLEESTCYMQVGNLGFEAAIIDKVRANNPRLRIVTTSDSITYITGGHHNGHSNGIDPHVWSSASNARIMAENMLRTVKEIDPANADAYTANFIALTARIDSVDSVCRTILTPLQGSAFMVWHPSLSYFARDYGLTQIAVGSEGKEQSVADTRAIIDRMDRSQASVFLVQKDFDTSRASVVASDNAAAMRISTINPLNYDWDSELLHTARAIAGED